MRSGRRARDRDQVDVAEGDQVETGRVLVVVEADGGGEGAEPSARDGDTGEDPVTDEVST